MRLPTFSSEFDSVVPLEGDPLEKTEQSSAFSALTAAERVEAAQQQVVLNAVGDYYLAKRFYEMKQQLDLDSDGRPSRALSRVAESLMKTAVSIAAANDAQDRTKSLHKALEFLTARVSASPGEFDRESTGRALRILQSWTNPALEPSLKYVRHLRNKWAGHAAFDRDVDPWADAPSVIDLPQIERALVILVNAHVLLAELIETEPDLAPLQPVSAAVDGDRTVIPMRVHWAAIDSLALLMREAARVEVEALGQVLRLGLSADRTSGSSDCLV